MKHAIEMLTVLAFLGCGGGANTAGGDAAGATAGAEHTERMPEHAGAMHGQGMRQGSDAMACPMMLEGAEVSVEDIDRGVAMTFTTDRAADVDELRERVRSMASMHERHAGMMGGGMMGREGGGMMPPSTATVVDVPGGARLELVASDAADVDSLRRHASMHAEHMRGRQGCPMMGSPAA